jgi:hypothetical protein
MGRAMFNSQKKLICDYGRTKWEIRAACTEHTKDVRFEDLTAVEIANFWGVTSCSLVRSVPTFRQKKK